MILLFPRVYPISLPLSGFSTRPTENQSTVPGTFVRQGKVSTSTNDFPIWSDKRIRFPIGSGKPGFSTRNMRTISYDVGLGGKDGGLLYVLETGRGCGR
ncbi:hypothetical protein SAY87_027727 [Trapa incisa]|uniref:Uncharacterized protein n=1 Tax=Trapa incisa TaxID=236973 RepID=A0AAN7JMV8_9MYRT|nr:hypothetical protein SAY87_027727 [Trapa incisa]